MKKETWEAGTRLIMAAEKIVSDQGMKTAGRSMSTEDGTEDIRLAVRIREDSRIRDGYDIKDRNRLKTGMNEEAWKVGYVFKGYSIGATPKLNEAVLLIDMKKEKKTFIYKTAKQETTWENIANVIKNGDAKDMFSVGDKVPFRMQDGTEAFAVAAHVTDNCVYFVIEDAVDKYPMYGEIPEDEPISWSGSDMRKYLNTDVADNLPSDLRNVIDSRMITQRIGGKEIVTEDKLWLPSHTEVFGQGEDGENYPTDGKNEFHFDLFSDERSRVKQYEGETEWWWTRTPWHADSGSSTTFRNVHTNGTAYYYYATLASSVCFGFCIGR